MKKTYKRVLALLLVFVTLFTIIGPNIAAFFTGEDAKEDKYTIGQIEVEVVGENDLYKAEHLTPNEEWEFKRAVKNIGINDAYVYMTVTIPTENIYMHDLDGVHTAEEAALTQLFTYGNEGIKGVNSEWKLVDAGHFAHYGIETVEGVIANNSDEKAAVRINNTVTYIYAYVGDGDTLKPLAADETTSNLFDTMKFVNASDTEAQYNIEKTIGQVVTKAYAIQVENVLETEYMTGNNADGSEQVNAVWDVINNALVRVNDQAAGSDEMFIVYVGEKHIVQPSLDIATNKYGQSLTTVHAISDTDLYNELVLSGEYQDISRDQNMDVIGGVITTEPATTMTLRNTAPASSMGDATYVIVAKDNTIIMAPDDMSEWFINLIHLKNVIFESFNFSNTTNMSNMFSGCSNLQQVVFPTYSSGNGTQGNYSNVSNVTNMFNGCTNLRDTNVDVFTNVTQASGVFNGCENITEIDLSNWKYVDVTWLTWLFNHSTNLETIKISAGAMQNIQKEATQEEFEELSKVVETTGTVPPVEKVEGEYTQLISGPEINNILKSINNTTPYKKIRFVSNTNIYEQIKTLPNYQDLSAEGISAFVGVIGDTCYIATQSGKTIYAPANSSQMFYQLTWVTVIDVGALDTSEMTSAVDMFGYCRELTQLDLSSFNTVALTDTKYMFEYCDKLTTIYVSGLWDIAHVGANNSDRMFAYCNKLIGQTGTSSSINYTGATIYDRLTFHTGKENTIVAGPNFNALLPSSVTEVYFGNYSSNIPSEGYIDLSVAQNESVVGWLDGTKFYITSRNGNAINTTGSMYQMFNGRSNINTIIFNNVNTTATFNMSNLFYNCSSLVELDINCFDTTRVTTMFNMFGGCSSIPEIDVSHFDTSSVTNMSNMFYGCSAATKINVSNFDTSNVTNTVDMFGYCRSLTQLDLSSFNTVALTDTKYMFEYCDKLTTIYVSNTWDIAHVGANNSDRMFANCNKLIGQTGVGTSVNYTGATIEDRLTYYNGTENTLVSGPNFNALVPSNITEIYIGDYHDNLPEQGLIDFSANEDWSIVGWVDNNALYVTSTNGKIINTTASMYQMFNGRSNINTIIFDNIDTSNVVYMHYMFYNCAKLTTLNIECLNTKSVTTMFNMFYGCASIPEIDASHFDTSSVTNMSNMFYGCSAATKINVSGFDTSNVANMYNMFGYCRSLTQLDLSSFNTSKVVDTRYMFEYCDKLTTIYVSNTWDIAHVGANNSDRMFANCNKLIGQTGASSSVNYTGATTSDRLTYYSGTKNTLVSGPNFNALVPSNITEIYIGDYHKKIPNEGLIDLSVAQDGSVVGWVDGTKFYVTSKNGDIIKTTPSMYRMFYNRTNITTIVFDNIDTSNVISMHYMFYYCAKLTTLDLECLNTCSVVDMNNMFTNCAAISEIDVSHFDTSSVTNMSNMFYQCNTATKINVSNFDTSNVTNMYDMFGYCRNVKELDLSSFNTSKVTDTKYMFEYCQELTTIYAGDLWNVSHVGANNSKGMFNYCYKLSGAGTDNASAVIGNRLTYKEYIPN